MVKKTLFNQYEQISHHLSYVSLRSGVYLPASYVSLRSLLISYVSLRSGLIIISLLFWIDDYV